MNATVLRRLHYFAMGGTNPRFESNCTALWRGYVGSWEIVDDRLLTTKSTGSVMYSSFTRWVNST